MLDAENPAVMIVAEGGDAGGIARYCVDLASALGGRAHVACLCTVPCLADDDCWLATQCSARRLRLHRISMPARGWRSGRRGLLDLWYRTDRPITHVNGRRGNSVAIALRLTVPGFTYVTTVHGILGLHSRRNAIHRVIDLAAGRLAKMVIAVSGDSRRVLIRAWSPRRRTVAIANGLAELDLQELRRVAAERDPPRHRGAPLRVGFLGRLSPEKGTVELLELARTLSVSGMAITFDIAGDGPEGERLMAACSAMTAAGFTRFRGAIRDTASFLREVDVLVIPSHNEGMPYVLLEAMAAGCAVVAFAVGGIPEVISSPRFGVLAKPGDVEALARAVARFADDPALVSTIGAAASAHIEQDFALASRLPEIWHAYGLDDLAISAPGDRSGGA